MELFKRIKKKKDPEIETINKPENEYIEKMKKTIVVVNPGSTIYHTKYKCPNVAGSGKSISLYEAMKLNYRECKKCKSIY